MPSDRITKTVWVASIRPKPNQMAAIPPHRAYEPVGLLFIPTILLYVGLAACRNAANRRNCAADGLAHGTEQRDTQHMFTNVKFALLLATVLLPLFAFVQATSAPKSAPEYTSDGQMKMPEDYRKWVYLTSGFDMSYNPAMQMGHDMFDNVFVNPAAYKAFLETGTWPDKTVMVVEVRGAKDKGSINKQGHYQDEIMGIEVHVKDERR